MTAPDVICNFLRVLLARAFIGDFIPLVTIKDQDYVALLGYLDPFPVRILREAPEQSPDAIRLPHVEAVGSPFLRNILDVQVRLPAECLDRLVNNCLCL